MFYQSSIGAFAIAAVLSVATVNANAFDDVSYPDWTGAWRGIGGGSFDTSKPRGLGQLNSAQAGVPKGPGGEPRRSSRAGAHRRETRDIAARRTACRGS